VCGVPDHSAPAAPTCASSAVRSAAQLLRARSCSSRMAEATALGSRGKELLVMAACRRPRTDASLDVSRSAGCGASPRRSRDPCQVGRWKLEPAGSGQNGSGTDSTLPQAVLSESVTLADHAGTAELWEQRIRLGLSSGVSVAHVHRGKMGRQPLSHECRSHMGAAGAVSRHKQSTKEPGKMEMTRGSLMWRAQRKAAARKK
jgi:hypothetical protein